MCVRLCVVLGLPSSVTLSLLLSVSVSVSAVQSPSPSPSPSPLEAKLFKWQLNSHKMKTRCLHCSYNFWSFLWHLKWLLDKGLTNGHCRIFITSAALACVCSPLLFGQLQDNTGVANRLIKAARSNYSKIQSLLPEREEKKNQPHIARD